MSGRDRRRMLTVRELAGAGLAAGVVLTLAMVGVGAAQRVVTERRAADDAVVVGGVATKLAVDLEEGQAAVAQAAHDVTEPIAVDPARAVVAGATRVELVTLPPAGGGGVQLGAGAGDQQEVAALLDRARDSGRPVMSGPIVVDEGEGHRTLIVAAAYQDDPELGRPATVTLRRARLAGWVVAQVDLAALLQARLPTGAVGTIRDGSVTVSAGVVDVPDDLPEQIVAVGGRELVVTAGDPTDVRRSGLGFALGLGGVGVAGLIAVAVVVGLRRIEELRAATAQRTDQVELIGEVAPLVQQSLELADVLPAVAVQLSDHFGLAGVAMSTGTSVVGQVGIFSVGATPDPSTPAVLRPPSELKAGETLSLAMQRGGRGVARLQLVAGRDLDAAELQSLRALTELVTAAVVNASLYASQQEALRNLRDLDALKTVFLGTASHELRTPATAISGFASLLTTSWDRFDETQRRDFVERIAANARSLSAVVQDLLDFSLLDEGAVSVSIESVDLPSVVAAVIERLSPMFTDHEVVISTQPAPAVDGDVNGLERVVTNLLTNAVKFSPAGTTITVTAGPTDDAAGAEVVVSDQGPGIPIEERNRIFTRFYRGAGDAVLATRGVGIGLSVVAELVGRLGGEVLLDDAPGGGARFTVRLPASPSHSVSKEAEHAPTS